MNSGSRDELLARLADPQGDRVHCMGIGGVGMAGVAALLQRHGFRVDGCDLQENRLTERLAQAGVPVFSGHEPAHLSPPPRFVVRSTAVADSHPEIVAARQLGIPVWRRGEVFPALLRNGRSIAISGTHGKTTTTALTAHALRGAGMDPGFFVGGEWEAAGRVFHAGTSGWMVVEADESDGTLANYHPDMAVITGIDFDHMEHFRDEQEFESVFRRFVMQTQKSVIVCGDDSRLMAIVDGLDIPFLRYGLGPECPVRAEDVTSVPMDGGQGSRFRVVMDGADVGTCQLPVPGRHNVVNALAALAVTRSVGADVQAAMASLASFQPVRRRFDRVGMVQGATVYNDYAHHPTEIRCLVEAARPLANGRLIAIFQPHRYTRTRALGAEFPSAFAGVDHVVLAPVYAASESPIEGGDVADLANHFTQSGCVDFSVADDLESAWALATQGIKAGDLLLLVGAGDVELLVRHVIVE